MNATYPTVQEQEALEPARTVPRCPESQRWLKEADKIIAAYPEKHREYHAMVLRHTYENGLYDANCAIKSLMAIKELIIKGEYSDERVVELINEGLQ
jgi:hypothetical protein